MLKRTARQERKSLFGEQAPLQEHPQNRNMRSTNTFKGFIPAAVLGTVLAFSGASSRAASAITYTFDSDVQSWYAADGNGTVAWDATHGKGGGGCLKAVVVAGSNTEVDPRIDVDVDSSQYFSVDMDVMIDAASGTGGSANYGNFQIAMRDASFSWAGMWYGAVDASFSGTYKHLRFILPAPYVAYAHLQLQLNPGAPSADIIAYIDNVTITPINPPTPVVLNAFNYPESVTKGISHSGAPQTLALDTTHDAGGGPTPTGSMQLAVNYATNSGWQEGTIQMAANDWDPSRFTYLDYDIYLDAPTGLSSYGLSQVFIIDSTWNWVGIGGVNLDASMIGKWTHVSRALPSLSSSHGYVFQQGGTTLANQSLTYYIDNITAWKPATPPSLTKLQKAGPSGLQITMDRNGDQWQRDGVTTPSGDFYSWVNNGGVTYSFTITNFPDAVPHPGYDAHLYMVNADTIQNLNGEYKNGAVDWDASDLVEMRVQNNGGGGVDLTLRYKTNLPAANADHVIASVHAPSALGTWSIAFDTSNTNVTLTGPGGVSTNLTLAQDVVGHFSGNMFLHFGNFKSDGNNNGINDQQSGTFSRIQVAGGLAPLDDSFGGPGLTANYGWQPSNSSSVLWVPPDTAYWLTWSLPDDGFTMQVAPAVTGPWNDAGITTVVPRGATRVGAVPASSIPSGNAAFFRMIK